MKYTLLLASACSIFALSTNLSHANDINTNANINNTNNTNANINAAPTVNLNSNVSNKSSNNNFSKYKKGFYISGKGLKTFERANSMSTSLRPGVGQFVSGKEKNDYWNASIAAGYQFGNGWRAEGEYTFNNSSEYTSGSSVFPTSFNHMRATNQRFMIHVYRDFYIANGFSVYGDVGIGMAKITTKGWQGNPSRKFASNTDTNVSYSVGAGFTYAPVTDIAILSHMNFDIGYRFQDLGKISSGLNNFTNVRGLQDEQMKGHLYTHDIYFGTRYTF